MRWLSLVFVIGLVAGCGTNSGTPSSTDMAISLPDLTMATGDMTVPTMCNPVDPMTDGQACGMAGCPAGTIGVGSGASCKCWQKCDPSTPTQCSCNRRCAQLVQGDAGVVGGACLVANGPGERCGQANTTGKNAEGCAQGLICVNADTAGDFRYCVYDCTGNAACPIQTACLQLTGVTTQACAYISIDNSTLAPGDACTANQSCDTGYLCDGTCKPQCDRVGATCASGTCTALSDGARTVGYVCK
jgi:hypothetical protein